MATRAITHDRFWRSSHHQIPERTPVRNSRDLTARVVRSSNAHPTIWSKDSRRLRPFQPWFDLEQMICPAPFPTCGHVVATFHQFDYANHLVFSPDFGAMNDRGIRLRHGICNAAIWWTNGNGHFDAPGQGKDFLHHLHSQIHGSFIWRNQGKRTVSRPYPADTHSPIARNRSQPTIAQVGEAVTALLPNGRVAALMEHFGALATFCSDRFLPRICYYPTSPPKKFFGPRESGPNPIERAPPSELAARDRIRICL